MQRPRFQLSLRGLMLVVAGIALLLSLCSYAPIAKATGRRAAVPDFVCACVPNWRKTRAVANSQLIAHSRKQHGWLIAADSAIKGEAVLFDRPSGKKILMFFSESRLDPVNPKTFAEYSREAEVIAAKCRLMATHYERMKNKWARVAALPWVWVAPDPPPPLAMEIDWESPRSGW